MTRRSSSRRVLALAAVGYVGLMYATSSAMRPVLNIVKDLTGAHFSLTVTLLVAAAGVGVLAAHGRALLRLSPSRGLALAMAAAGYALAFQALVIPEERFHLAQFGVLSWLVTESGRGQWPGWRLHLFSLGVVALAGTGDEVVQHFAPNRVGDLRDVWINWAAALLAQTALYGVLDSAGPKLPPTERPALGEALENA
jgi:hypothetical protein